MSSPETEIVHVAMSEPEAGMIAERLRNAGIEVWLRPQGIGFLGNPFRVVEVLVSHDDVPYARELLQEPWEDEDPEHHTPALSDDGKLS